MIELELITVRVDLPGNTPVLVLREVAGAGRLLPIFIGGPEASAIAFALDGVVPQRPMTHDLLRTVIEDLDASLQKVTITAVDQGTFYAELALTTASGVKVISSRPSDAIALALRTGSPIWADEAVLDEAGVLPDEEQVDDDAVTGGDVVEQFREFIDSVNPDDFAS